MKPALYNPNFLKIPYIFEIYICFFLMCIKKIDILLACKCISDNTINHIMICKFHSYGYSTQLAGEIL